MFPSAPDKEDILAGTRTTSGTLVTVPPGKWYTGNVILSASVAVAGNSAPTISVNGTNATPVNGTVIAQLNVVGLALTTVSDSVSTEILVYADTDPITIDFTAGATGSSSASINGYIFG